MRAATFTTYINAQEDPGLQAAFQRQAQIATSSYAVITQAAEAASRATAGLLGGKGTTGAGQGTAAIQQRAAATRAVTTAAAEAERASIRMASATTREASAASHAARENSALARSLTTTATALNVVQGPLGPIAGRISALSRAVTELTGLRLGLAAFGATLFAIGRVANEYTNVQNRLRPLFDTQVEFNGAFKDVIRIAQASRQPLSEIAELYSRITIGGRDIGLSQARIARVTELASKAATISGGAPDIQARGLVQFSQGLGRGVLQGQDLKAVLEDIPVLGQQIAAGFKNADGSIGTTIGHLRDLGAQGELTGQAIADALERSASRIDTMFGRLPKTLGSAAVEFKNALEVQLGAFDQASGFTSTLAQSLSVVANNLRVIAALAVGAGTAFAVIKIGNLVKEGASAVIAARAVALQVKELDAAWLRDADIAAKTVQGEIILLEEEQAQIRETIALLDRKALAASRDVVRETPSPSTGYAGSTRRMAAAENELQDALARRRIQQDTLIASERNLEAAHLRSAATSKTLETATENVGKRVGFLRGAVGGLVGFLGGPWGVALTAATAALYLLSTAESDAERATRLHEDAQRDFAGVIDRTTGKIYDQVDALQKLAIQKKTSDDVDANYRGFQQSSNNLVSFLRNFTRPLSPSDQGSLVGAYSDPRSGRSVSEATNLARARIAPDTPARRELDLAISEFAAGRSGAYARLTAAIDRNKDSIPGLRAAIPQLGTIIGSRGGRGTESSGLLGYYSRVQQGEAAQRVLRGNAQPGDVALALGENPLTTNGSTKPKTKRQVDADARAQAAQTNVEQARAALAKIKADGQQPGESESQYQDRLAAAYRGVTDAVNAQSAARRGAAAGRAQERKDARDAIQAAKDEAAAREGLALKKLAESGIDPKSQDYINQREKIIQTYKEEIDKIDGRAKAAGAGYKAEAEAIEKAHQAADAFADKRTDILAAYDDAPKSIDKARKSIRELQEVVDRGGELRGAAFFGKTEEQIAEIKKINPLGYGLYTQEMADADAKRIEYGVRKPLRDLQRDYDRSTQIAYLQLQGRDAEAEAVRKRNQLLDDGLTIEASDYNNLVANERQQLRINDALAARQRVVSTITGALDSARDTAEQLFTGLQTGQDPSNLFKTAFKDFQTQFARINSRRLVEQLFAGSDEKLRALLEGKSRVDVAIDSFGTSVDALSTSTEHGESAVDRFAKAAEDAASRLDDIRPAAGSGNLPAGGATAALGLSAISSALGIGSGSLLSIISAADKAANDNGQPGDIVVQGQRPQPRPVVPLPKYSTPGAREVYNLVGGQIFSGLDRVVDKLRGRRVTTDDKGVSTTYDKAGNIIGGSRFFSQIGAAFGTALQGAGQGQFASGIAAKIGIKQSSTGASIGGALGELLKIPGGGLIGGLIGGTLGGLFSKAKVGGASITASGVTAVGNDKAAQKEGTAAGNAVISGINSLVDTLHGSGISDFGTITVGKYKDKYRVNDHGTNLKSNNDVLEFDSLAEAQAFALWAAVSRGAVKGISEASQRILAAGRDDLEAAAQKAAAIENIPRRLLQLTDPVRYAVTTLNEEFAKLISYLKEGGASAQQFSDAQKLYDLERTQAIQEATNQAREAIDQFLKEMVGSAQSPLNKLDTYQNAAGALNAFKSDIASGKTVDQNSLLSAAKNFQDASRSLFGSSSSFFDDFNMLRSLLEKARDNAGVSGDVTTLPPSPFANDTTVQNAIASLQDSSAAATQAQTDTLGTKLDEIRDAINRFGTGAGGNGYYGYDSPIYDLPGFLRAG